MCRMEPIARPGTTPIGPAGTALGQLLMAHHGAHPTPRFHDANISMERMTCGRISGLWPRHRSQKALRASCCSVTRRARQKQPPPMGAGAGLSDTDYSDSSCLELPATTCLF